MSGPYKVIVIGEAAVGKNEILWKIKADKTSGGVDYTPKTYDVDGTKICLHIHDTVADEKNFKISPSYFHGVKAVVVMYDVTNKVTFEHLGNWFKSIKQSVTPDTFVAIVGTKSHMITERKVYRDKAEGFADQNGAMCYEVSAMKKGDVDRVFSEIAKELLKK